MSDWQNCHFPVQFAFLFFLSGTKHVPRPIINIPMTTAPLCVVNRHRQPTLRLQKPRHQQNPAIMSPALPRLCVFIPPRVKRLKKKSHLTTFLMRQNPEFCISTSPVECLRTLSDPLSREPFKSPRDLEDFISLCLSLLFTCRY